MISQKLGPASVDAAAEASWLPDENIPKGVARMRVGFELM